MTILKGGEILPSSGSGITINGKKTLEEVIAEEEAKELGEQVKPDRVHIYHSICAKFKDFQEPNGFARVLSRREINAERWEAILMRAKTLDEAVISILLSGREYTGTQIRQLVMQQNIPNVNQKFYDYRMNHLSHKTALGKFIVRRRAGKGKTYKFVSAALDCKPEELAVFVYSNKQRHEAVLQHHPALRGILQAEENQRPKEQTQPQKPEIPLTGERLGEINGIIETAIREALGINVNISGTIEIKFTFG